MQIISFKNHGISPDLKNKSALKAFMSKVFKNEGFDFERILYIFTTDAALLELNRQFLNHDTLTDILTFTMSGAKSPISSEIYISIERVRENAIIFNATFSKELQRVMIHGALHLCGYSDHTLDLKTEMRKREDYYLSQFHFT